MASTATSITKPVRSFRVRGISASIFANPVKKGESEFTRHNVVVQRSFKDGDEYKNTSSFGRDDLPVVRHVLDQAWEYILDAESSKKKADAA